MFTSFLLILECCYLFIFLFHNRDSQHCNNVKGIDKCHSGELKILLRMTTDNGHGDTHGKSVYKGITAGKDEKSS